MDGESFVDFKFFKIRNIHIPLAIGLLLYNLKSQQI